MFIQKLDLAKGLLFIYELLLDDINAATLMNEDNFETDTGPRDRLLGVKQEDRVLTDEGKLAAGENQGPQG